MLPCRGGPGRRAGLALLPVLRALVGLQVPPAERARFKAHLAETGLECVDETDSAGYRLFLA